MSSINKTPRKPGRPFSKFSGDCLSTEMAIEKALEIARSQGLAKLTIQNLAKALNVSRAPIYVLFASRQALVDATINRILNDIGAAHLSDNQSWQDQVRQFCLATFESYQQYPGLAAELVRTGFPDSDTGSHSARHVSKLMLKSGAPKSLIPTLIFAFTSLIIGAEMEFSGQEKREQGDDVAKRQLDKRRGDTLPPAPLGMESLKSSIDILILGVEALAKQQAPS